MSSSATHGTKVGIISVSSVFAPSSLVGPLKFFFFQNCEQFFFPIQLHGFQSTQQHITIMFTAACFDSHESSSGYD